MAHVARWLAPVLAAFSLVEWAGSSAFAQRVAVPDEARAQFTPAQLRQLQSLRTTSLIVPTWFPAGYHVQAVEHVVRVEIGSPPERGYGLYESYTIRYGNGTRTIEWFGASEIGGLVLVANDPELQSFQARYRSPVLGAGVVLKASSVLGNCWITNALAKGGERFDNFPKYTANGHYTVFMLNACGLAPGEVARMMESAVVVKP